MAVYLARTGSETFVSKLKMSIATDRSEKFSEWYDGMLSGFAKASETCAGFQRLHGLH